MTIINVWYRMFTVTYKVTEYGKPLADESGIPKRERKGNEMMYDNSEIFVTSHKLTHDFCDNDKTISYSATFAESLKICYAIAKSANNADCTLYDVVLLETAKYVVSAREELLAMPESELNAFLCNIVRHARKIDMAECDKSGEHKRSVMFWVKSNDDVQTVANESYCIMCESLFDKMPDKPLKMVATIAALRAADRIYPQERKKGNALSLDDENDMIIIDQLQTKAEHIAPSPESGTMILDSIVRAAKDATDFDVMAFRAMGYGVAEIGHRIGKSHVAVVKRLANIEKRHNDANADTRIDELHSVVKQLSNIEKRHNVPKMTAKEYLPVIAWNATMTAKDREKAANNAEIEYTRESIQSAWNFYRIHFNEYAKAAIMESGYQPIERLYKLPVKIA